MYNTQLLQKKPAQRDIETAVDIVDIVPTLRNLLADAKAKAKENAIFTERIKRVSHKYSNRR